MNEADKGGDLHDVAEDAHSPIGPPANAAEAFQIADASGGSLRHRLDIYSSYSRGFFPKTNQLYDEIITQLDLSNAGPPVGSIMPEFMLPDQDGKLTRLDSLLSEGPLILSLNRGHWCPWCRLELRALAQIYDDVLALNGQAVSIMPETAAYSRKVVDDNKLPFRILTDIDFGYTLELGMVIWLGEKLRELYSAKGPNLPRFHGNDGWFLPVPATFVLGADGIVMARYAEPNFRQRMEPKDILAALTLLKG